MAAGQAVSRDAVVIVVMWDRRLRARPRHRTAARGRGAAAHGARTPRGARQAAQRASRAAAGLARMWVGRGARGRR